MKETTFTLNDINKEMLLSADLYLRTVIINKKRHYIKKTTKLSRHGIIMLEIDKYESNFIYNDNYFDNLDSTHFYIKGQHIPISIPEIAEALRELSETHLQILLQSVVLQMTIEEIATELGISKRMVYRHKHNAIEELRKKLKDYEK